MRVSFAGVIRLIRSFIAVPGPALAERRTSAVAVFLFIAFATSRALSLWRNSRGANWYFPSMAGADLVVLVVFAVLVRSTAPWRPVRPLVAFVLAVVGMYLVMNQMLLLFTGATLSWGTLRGDEGVTLADIELMEPIAIVAGALVLALVTTAAIVAGTFGARVAPPFFGTPRFLAALALTAAILLGVGAWRGQGIPLDHNPVVQFVKSTLSQDDEPGRPLSPDEWAQLFASRAPSTEQAPPPPLDAAKRPKNAIIWLAEGIALKHTTLSGGPREAGAPDPRSGGGSALDTTPNLKRRADAGGLQFTRWYSTFHKSIHAMFSVACSEYPPPYRLAITATKPRIDCGSLPETLRGAGFAQGLFHGGFFSFTDKLGFFGGRGFDTTIDALDLKDERGYKWKRTKWGVDDRAMVDRMLTWVDGLPKDKRFFALAIPIAPHYPRDVPDDALRLVPPKGDPAKYKNAVRFSDDVFERFMKGMEARGLLNDTLVFYVADHGESLEEPERPSSGDRQVYDPDLHVPAVMFHPPSFPAPVKSDRLANHVDVAPTVLSLLGVPPDPRNRGRSVFAPDFSPRRIFLEAYQNDRATIGIVDGDTKYVWNARTDHTEVYDLRADPGELNDLAESRAAEAEAAGRDAAMFRGAQLARLAAYPVLKEEDIEQQVFTTSELQVNDGDKVTKCAAAPDAFGHRVCPGVPTAAMSVARVVVAGAPRDCIAVDLPAKKTVRFKLQGAALTRMTSVRVAFPDAVKLGAPSVKIEGIEGKKATSRARIQSRFRDRTVHIPESARAAQAFTIALTSETDVPVCIVLSGSNWW